MIAHYFHDYIYLYIYIYMIYKYGIYMWYIYIYIYMVYIYGNGKLFVCNICDIHAFICIYNVYIICDVYTQIYR